MKCSVGEAAAIVLMFFGISCTVYDTMKALKPSVRRAHANRIIMFCTALNPHDTPTWPLWKWLQLKATKGLTDFVMLAITSEESFIARIDGEECSYQPLKPSVREIDYNFMQQFFDDWYSPGNSFLVYGGHGVGDYLDLKKEKYQLPTHKLAAMLGDKQFLGILFDACLMANLDTAYYLRRNTRYIGAAEGYMWEEDTWHVNHIFNPYAASAMCRYKNPLRILTLIQEEYVRKSKAADFAVIDTQHVSELFHYVYEPSRLEQLYNMIDVVAPSGSAPPTTVIPDNRWNSGIKSPQGYKQKKSSRVVTMLPMLAPPDGDEKVIRSTSPTLIDPAPDTVVALQKQLKSKRANAQFPFSVGYKDVQDDHLVDLFSCFAEDANFRSLFQKVVVGHESPTNRDLYPHASLQGLSFSFSVFEPNTAPLNVTMPPTAVLERLLNKIDIPEPMAKPNDTVPA